MLGSAANLEHRPIIRLAYAMVALLVGKTGALVNALVSANPPNIQGHLGAYTCLRCLTNSCPRDGKCLRQSYYVQGPSAVRIAPIRKVRTRRLPSSNDCAHIRRHVRHGVTVRALSGLAGAVCSTLGTFYMLQAFLKASLIKRLILGLGITQLATPIAWQLSSALIDLGQSHCLYVFAAGLAMCAPAAVAVLELPVIERIRVLQLLDFLTFALVALGLAAIRAVLASGGVLWWFEQPWLGRALAAAVVILITAWGIEHFRQRHLSIHVG